MKKRWALLIVVLALLVAATPVLASGGGNQGGNQNGHQNQEQNQDQDKNQDQEQNQGEGQSQEQNQNQEQNHNQEQNGQGGQPASRPGKQFFTLTGNISALDPSAITVMVHNGNRFVKPYVGQDLVVSVTGGTVYRMYTPDGCVPIDFEDLEIGDSVSIVGSVNGDAFTAQRVTVDVPCCTP